jgi:MFS family permease
MLFILRDDPAERGYRSWAPAPQTDDALAKISVWDSLRTLPKKDLALLCLGQTAVTGSVVMMAGLWGVPFLTTLFDVSSRTAVGLTSLIPIGFAAGSLVFGPWSDRTGRRKKPLLVGTLGVFAGFILLASGISLSSLWATAALLSMIGISSGSMVVAFAYGKDLVGGRRTATITALVNLSVTLGSLGLQPLFGVILDWQWDGLVVEGVRRYDATAFQWGFAATALWLGLTAIAQWKTRDAVSPAKTLGLASPGG